MDRRLWSAVAVGSGFLALLIVIGFIIAYQRKASSREIEHAHQLGEMKGKHEAEVSALKDRIGALEQEGRNQAAYIEDFRLRLTKAGLMD